VGLALQFNGMRQNKPDEVRTGRGVMFWGMIAFLALAALFELAIFGGMAGATQWIVPLLLIGVGVLLLGRGIFFRGTDKPKRVTPPSYSDKLQRQIDAALAEDAPTHTDVNKIADVPEEPKA
jgi:hypothetical protein